jgi:hypothetical protein
VSEVGTPISVRTRPRWRLRLELQLLRWLLCGLAATGIVVAARTALLPPRPLRVLARPTPSLDPATAGFASLFARAYLSWDAADPAAHERALAPFLTVAVDPDAGFAAPAAGAQRVLWTEVVQQRDVGPAERVDTVAADTDRLGLIYLTVDVVRRADGALALARYPGIVGAPAMAPSPLSADDGLPSVSDPQLTTVVRRVLTNYLDGDGTDLAADLAPDARVAPSAPHLSLTGLYSLRWDGRGAVLARVRATDAAGASYTLEYEVDAELLGGRWEVVAIGADPEGSLS